MATCMLVRRRDTLVVVYLPARTRSHVATPALVAWTTPLGVAQALGRRRVRVASATRFVGALWHQKSLATSTKAAAGCH